jgi:citronellol/citronellal dehydrogenase
LSKPAAAYSGHFLIDDEVLSAEGERDFDRYRVDGMMPLQLDLFIDPRAPVPPGVTLDPVISTAGRSGGCDPAWTTSGD